MYELCHTHVFLCTAFVHFPPAQMLPLQTFVSNPHRAGADLILTYYATQAAKWMVSYVLGWPEPRIYTLVQEIYSQKRCGYIQCWST